jgi:uncharacterized protein YdaT
MVDWTEGISTATLWKKWEAVIPWTGKSFAAKHNKKLSGARATKAASIANAIIRGGGDEGVAIATANKRAGQYRPPSKGSYKRRVKA